MEQFQMLPIKKIFESPLNPRQHFNAKKMEELIASVKATKGIMVPLIVRPCKNRFEIAAGHRRYRAAIEAKFTEIPALTREMSDADFLEVLTIENLQHEDITPLDEARSFQVLIEKNHCTVGDIAAKLGKGKSESYIYQRIKLLELIPEAQRQLTEEKITAGHAILIARLQPDQQKEVLKEGLFERYGRHDPETVSVRSLADYIESNIHLDLNSASFKKNDPDLVPEAGPCTTCLKRTGSAPALFPEIKKKDTCTDPSCFHKKIQAFTLRWVEEKSQDSDVIPLKLSTVYRSRIEKLPGDLNKVISAGLYHEITAKNDGCSHAREAIITEGHDPGRVLTVCIDPQCEKHHQAYSSFENQKYKAQQKAGEEKRKLAFKIREAILDAILKAWGLPGKLFTKEDLLLLTKEFYKPIWTEFQKKILARRGLKPKKGQYTQDYQAPMNEWLAKQGSSELLKFLLEIALFRDIERQSTDKRQDDLIETAKRYGVDPKKIEAEFRLQVKEKAKGQKKSVKTVEKAKTIKDICICGPGKQNPSCKAHGGKKKSPSVKQKPKRKDPPDVTTIAMKDICKLHAPAKKKGEPKAGVCQECGCTETTPCEGGCAWTDKTKTLCTACKMAKEHHWEKQNLVTVASGKGFPMHDVYKCKKCGATAKRFGVAWPPRRDEKFAKLEECPGPKKEVQTSAKEKK